MTSKLFTPIKLRNLEIKNRIFMAPMCQYSATEGVPNEWHKIHLVSRAIGGVGLILVEATGVVPEGRISDYCLGIYNQQQVDAFKPITKLVKEYGARIGIQLAHSGRKGEGNFNIVAPSAISFSEKYRVPKELSVKEIEEVAEAFLNGAKNALESGFETVEIHMAHGYLLHQFLSPHSNKRNDQYGGTLENRMRLPLLVAKKVRDFWPNDLPVFIRLSATDWIGNDGLDIDEIIIFVNELKKLGIDFIDVSTGGNVSSVKIPVEPNYQVKFANEIKNKTGIATGAVGLITEAIQAEKILEENKADVILLGRVLLRDPYWAVKASLLLDKKQISPVQYERGF